MTMVARRWGGPAAVVAGVAWLLIWYHQQTAHGPTQVNEMRLVAGLTWMDTSKVVAVLFALLLLPMATLAQRRGTPRRLGQVGRALAVGSLMLLIVTTIVQFWTFAWGSYAVSFEEASGFAGSNASGAVQFVASLVFTLGLAIWSVDLVGARVIPLWLAVMMVLGGLTTVFLSPVLLLPGVSWLALGLVVWRTEATRPPASLE